MVGADGLIGVGDLVRAGYNGRGAFGPPFLLILIKLISNADNERT